VAAGPDAHAPASLNIALLVFREGLECILVLAAVTANMSGARQAYRRPVFVGVVAGAAATVVTWHASVAIVRDLSGDLTALQLQALTGMLAVVVLLLVMNWFFHQVYWTGWIAFHSRKKEALLKDAATRLSPPRAAWVGLVLLGFSSLYREGFEVVLFLQSYRLRVGSETVGVGLAIGLLFTAMVAVLTFVSHRRLPYRKMLVLTGGLLGLVLLVMVGEQAQEMQQAGWLPTTRLAWLAPFTPDWIGVWLSIFPTLETLAAQALAATFVVGSYVAARPKPPARRPAARSTASG
jgi:high-affinity iron transporter